MIKITRDDIYNLAEHYFKEVTILYYIGENNVVDCLIRTTNPELVNKILDKYPFTNNQEELILVVPEEKRNATQSQNNDEQTKVITHKEFPIRFLFSKTGLYGNASQTIDEIVSAPNALFNVAKMTNLNNCDDTKPVFPFFGPEIKTAEARIDKDYNPTNYYHYVL